MKTLTKKEARELLRSTNCKFLNTKENREVMKSAVDDLLKELHCKK